MSKEVRIFLSEKPPLYAGKLELSQLPNYVYLPAECLVGMKVVYRSRSGREYQATITEIPENPWHGYTDRPTVALEFRDQRGKLIRKPRVLPRQDPYHRTMVWYEEVKSYKMEKSCGSDR